ncbi:MAG: hypothetical protein U0V49_00265 [Saprospiraceae bacterium]
MNKIIPSPKEHVFFSSMAIILAAVIVCGFSNTYLPKLLNNPVIVPEIVHLHALIFSLWLAFFVFQVTLILRKKYDLHRRLGSYGVLFSFAMGVVGCATAVEVAKLGHIGIPGVEFPDAEGFLLLNLTSLFSFVSLTVLGWLFRNNASMHKRFMLMANAGGLTPPAVARLPFIAGSTPAIAIVSLLLILAGPIYDLIRYRRIHWVYLCCIAIIILSLPPVVLALSGMNLWKEIASFLMR